MYEQVLVLHNRYNKEELIKQLENEEFVRETLSFYRYVHITNPVAFRDFLYMELSKLHVLGRIYVAYEGINAQISIPPHMVDKFRELAIKVPELNHIHLNFAVDDNGKSFYKLTIKVREKIVADGLKAGEIDVTDSGTHLNAREFHELADSPGTLVVDMRNHYESEIGRFVNAICPDAESFRDALTEVAEKLENNKDKKLLLYCTGGIRCEKASAYLKHVGFKDVNQLKGGIIEYARYVKTEGLTSKYIGKNFVFDERLGEKVTDDVISYCHQCGKPCNSHTNCANDMCHLLFIQCDDCSRHLNGCCCKNCKDILDLPEEEKIILKKQNPFKQFNKRKAFSYKMGVASRQD